MKVPVEDADRKDGAENLAQEEAGGATSQEELDARKEAELVEAAKRAGEAAAEADFKASAEKAREEAGRLQSQLDEAASKAEDAEKRAADAEDRLLRLQADWDNYRRRTAQERNDERSRAAEKLVTSLLPVLDDMERACEHAANAAAGDEGLMQFVDGINAVHDKMLSILGKDGVEVINPVGEPFDPLVHQAVGREENKDAYDETVAQVYQKGYRMGGKVIRTAMVTVTFGGPRRPAETGGENDAQTGGTPEGSGAPESK